MFAKYWGLWFGMMLAVPSTLALAQGVEAAHKTFEKGKSQIVTARVPADLERSQTVKCGKWQKAYTFPEQPSLSLSLEAPVKDLHITAISADGELAVLVKPAGSDTPPKCYFHNFYLTLDPGEHEFTIGQKKGQPGVTATLIAREAPTKLNFLDYGLPIPDELKPEQRVAQDFFPLLPTKLDWEYLPRHTRQELFIKAAPKLVLYTTFQMDKDSAGPYYWQILSDYYQDLLKQPIFPKANEPVIITHRFGKDKVFLMTADGLIYESKTKYLALAPKGKLFMPTQLRHLIMDLTSYEKVAEPKDLARIKKLQTRLNKMEDCWQDYMDQHGGNAHLQEVTYVNNRVQKVRSYKNVVAKRAVARCGTKRIEAQQRKMMKRLNRWYRAKAAKAF